MTEFENRNPDTEHEDEMVKHQSRRLGSEALISARFDDDDTITYKEVIELMEDPNDFRAAPGSKRSRL